MYFEFPCAKCKKNLKIPEDRRSTKVRCPHCNHAQVPQAAQVPQGLPPLDDLSDPMSLLGDPFAPVPSGAAAAAAAKTPPKPAAPLSPEAGAAASDGAPTQSSRIPPAPSRERPSRSASGRKKSDASAHLKFECPQCNQHLSAPPVLAGQMVNCPSCGNRVRAPEFRKTERQAWKEADPTNPPFLKSLGIATAVLVLWFLLLLPFNPPADTQIADYNAFQWLASLFYKHFTVSVINTLFFTWAMSIIFLKHRKIRLQKAALLLDVLPTGLGKKIHSSNVAVFIDHVYSLPVSLRDSLMVNRIRKALELFEVRQNVSNVRDMLVSQSDIDSARISGSYTLVRAFLWGIPLLGFIGTVVGLSHAIGGMNFSNVDDVGKVVGAINNVTSGLGTAFDATLLGLVLALTLNFPLNALAKQEDDTLHTIDAFCNEVLLPRLKEKEPAGSQTADTAAIAKAVARSMSGNQEKFLADVGELAEQMNGYADNLDRRMEAFQQTVTEQFVTKSEEMRAENRAALEKAIQAIVEYQQSLGNTTAARNEDLCAETSRVLKQSSEQVEKYLGNLAVGIVGLNRVLAELGEKQIVITAPRRRWFGRG
jgi:DNA-directed RNA polymerase subunit RPC12/RpoP